MNSDFPAHGPARILLANCHGFGGSHLWFHFPASCLRVRTASRRMSCIPELLGTTDSAALMQDDKIRHKGFVGGSGIILSISVLAIYFVPTMWPMAVGVGFGLLVALASDLIFPSFPGIYHCGNLFLLLLEEALQGKLGLDTIIELEVPVTVGEEVLRPGFGSPPPERLRITVRDLLLHSLTILDMRGRLQAGLVLFRLGGTHTVKINTPKRGPLPKALLAAFELAAKGHTFVLENGILRLSAHVRAPTSVAANGKLEPDAAQPHQYQKDREEHVGEFVMAGDGVLDFLESEKKRTIIVKQGHNGDGEQMEIQARLLETSSHMYDVLDRVLGLSGTKRVGDSKAISGLADFFFTQGRATDSVRLAYHTRLVRETDTATSVRFPPQELFEGIGRFLYSAVRQQTRKGRLGKDKMRLSQVPLEQRQELKARLLESRNYLS